MNESLLHFVVNINILPCTSQLLCRSIGVLAGLEAFLDVSLSKSIIYFCWENVLWTQTSFGFTVCVALDPWECRRLPIHWNDLISITTPHVNKKGLKIWNPLIEDFINCTIEANHFDQPSNLILHKDKINMHVVKMYFVSSFLDFRNCANASSE